MTRTIRVRSPGPVHLRLCLILLALASTHILLSWGHVAIWWGDTGRWLHEVDRFVGGEALYADYYWPAPPLAIWALGWVGRALGSDVPVMFAACSAVFLLITVLHSAYVKRLHEQRAHADPLAMSLAGATSLLLAIGLAQVGGSPLTAGMYTPAQPIGFLFLLGALVLAIGPGTAPGPRTDVAIGALCAGAVLAKHDFWLPAVATMVVALALESRDPGRGRPRSLPRQALPLGLSFAVVLGAGLAAVVRDAGLGVLPMIVTGGGQVSEVGGRGLPSWERLTLEITVTGGLVGLVVGSLVAGGGLERRRGLAWLGGAAAVTFGGTALLLSMALGEASDPLAALRALHNEVVNRPLPAILPVGVLALAVVRLRPRSIPAHRLLVGALVVCVFARARRLFEGTEWFHAMLELPVYAVLLPTLWPRAGRVAARVTLAALFAYAIYAHWELGRGWLTKRGQYVAIETARGTIRVSPTQAEDYRRIRDALQPIPPDRPLFALGYTGGFSYFLGRTNPAHTTQGFGFSYEAREAVLADVLGVPGGLILLDSRAFDDETMPLGRLSLTAWKLELRPFGPALLDREIFDRIAATCVQADTLLVTRERFFVVTDCRW